MRCLMQLAGKVGYRIPEKARNLLASAITSDELVIRSGLPPSL